MKTLVVDDELVSRLKLQKILQNLGEVTAVENGQEALAAFRRGWREELPYDLICLDISMPGKSGLDVLFEIREAEQEMGVIREKPIRVIMITSHRDKDTIITSIQAGCDDYIVKPFNRIKVFQKLKKIGIAVPEELLEQHKGK